MLEEALSTVGQALAMPVVVTEMATGRGAAARSQPMAATGLQGAVLPPRTPPPPQIAGPAASGGVVGTEQGVKSHQMKRAKSDLGSFLCCVQGVLWLAAPRMYPPGNGQTGLYSCTVDPFLELRDPRRCLMFKVGLRSCAVA